VLIYMLCETPKNRVRPAIPAHRAVNMLMESRHGAPHSVRRAPAAIPGTAAMLALKFGDLFQFAQGFGFDGFGFVFGIEDGFEFFFFAEQGAYGLGVVQGEAAFLNAGTALELSHLSGDRIGDWRSGD
jgi:hypothetical protein